MREFFIQQAQWSYQTFGNPKKRGPRGPLLHLKKEVEEALIAQPDMEECPEAFEKFIGELVDCQFLIFDAVHRSGVGYPEFMERCFVKLHKNRNREWPPNENPNLPVEHDRSRELSDGTDVSLGWETE